MISREACHWLDFIDSEGLLALPPIHSEPLSAHWVGGAVLCGQGGPVAGLTVSCGWTGKEAVLLGRTPPLTRHRDWAGLHFGSAAIPRQVRPQAVLPVQVVSLAELRVQVGSQGGSQ